MGSICCCCAKESDPNLHKSKATEGVLKRAKLMTRTTTGKPICKQINRRFVSKAKQQELRHKTSFALKIVLSEPLNQFSRISEHLYLTGVGGMNAEDINGYDIKCIVNVTYELPVYDIEGIVCIRIPVDDRADEDISIYFDEISDKINKWIKHKDNVVVHCLCGVSRSVTIVMAYLMKCREMTLKESFNFVRKSRPFIRPNNGFFGQLIVYEKQLFRRTTALMIESRTKSGDKIKVPDFFIDDYPELVSSDPTERTLESSISVDESPNYISMVKQSM